MHISGSVTLAIPARDFYKERKMAVDFAAQLAFFLLEKTGSIFGTWSGKLPALEQRELFGKRIGKGTIVIDGARETVRNRVKVCFGLDYDDKKILNWRSL
jgi:hypothetical protein